MFKSIQVPGPTQLILPFVLLLLLVSAGGVTPVLAQSEDAPKPEKLFESSQTLAVSLSAPWGTIVRDKNNQSPYAATIEFVDSLGNRNSIPLMVERRGLTRQAVCKFPPIKLLFDKERVKGTTFRGENSLKLVTHCDRGSKWEQYYVKEMLAYQMYNLITDLSFRVQPLSITYVDSGRGSEDGPRFAFLIEDDSDVAKRNDMKKLDASKVSPRQLEPVEASRFALFQYMIANVDFAATVGPDAGKCCHNARLIGLSEVSDIYSIPYDFDSSGMVDAHYAAPHESLPIRNVTTRLFRGYCIHNSTLDTARQEFLAQEQAIYALVRNESRLSERSAKSVLSYLQRFFDTLRNPAEFQENVIQKCRK